MMVKSFWFNFYNHGFTYVNQPPCSLEFNRRNYDAASTDFDHKMTIFEVSLVRLPTPCGIPHVAFKKVAPVGWTQVHAGNQFFNSLSDVHDEKL